SGHVGRHAVQSRRRLCDPALLGDGLEDLEGIKIQHSHLENDYILIIHFVKTETDPTMTLMALRHPLHDARPVRAPSPAAVAVTGLAALAVAMGVGRFAFTPILPLMQQETGLRMVDAGWLASANYFGYLIGALTASVVATHIESRSAIRG